MNIHLLYSLKTGKLMSYIIPSNEKESEIIDKTIRIPEGQADLIITEKEYGNGGEDLLQGIVSQSTGLVPVEKRYAIVDKATGDVVTATWCTEDSVFEGCDLVEHHEAREGWRRLTVDTFENLNPPDPPKPIIGEVL